MSLFYRIALIALSLALVAAAYAMHTHSTQVTIAHETITTMKSNWVHNVHLFSFFGVIAWCVLFARRDPLFTRIGLVALAVASALPFLR